MWLLSLREKMNISEKTTKQHTVVELILKQANNLESKIFKTDILVLVRYNNYNLEITAQHMPVFITQKRHKN